MIARAALAAARVIALAVQKDLVSSGVFNAPAHIAALFIVEKAAAVGAGLTVGDLVCHCL